MLDQAVGHYWTFARDASGDIPRGIAESLRARRYYLDFVPSGTGLEMLVAGLLKCAWLTLAPKILDCSQAADAAWALFVPWVRKTCPMLPVVTICRRVEELGEVCK